MDDNEKFIRIADILLDGSTSTSRKRVLKRRVETGRNRSDEVAPKLRGDKDTKTKAQREAIMRMLKSGKIK